MIFPSARAHLSRKHRIERQGNPTREANLASMRMPADQYVKISIGGLPIDFRSMGNQNGELIGRDSNYSLFDIVHSVKMGVIDADQMDAVLTALDRFCLVHQESDPQIFQPWQQSDGVVIAEHAVSRPPDGGSNASHFNKRRLEGSECLPPVVACQNADVVAYLPHK